MEYNYNSEAAVLLDISLPIVRV